MLLPLKSRWFQMEESSIVYPQGPKSTFQTCQDLPGLLPRIQPPEGDCNMMCSPLGPRDASCEWAAPRAQVEGCPYTCSWAAHSESRSWSGRRRGQTLGWGPWAGTGSLPMSTFYLELQEAWKCSSTSLQRDTHESKRMQCIILNSS